MKDRRRNGRRNEPRRKMPKVLAKGGPGTIFLNFKPLRVKSWKITEEFMQPENDMAITDRMREAMARAIEKAFNK